NENKNKVIFPECVVFSSRRFFPHISRFLSTVFFLDIIFFHTHKKQKITSQIPRPAADLAVVAAAFGAQGSLDFPSLASHLLPPPRCSFPDPPDLFASRA